MPVEFVHMCVCGVCSCMVFVCLWVRGCVCVRDVCFLFRAAVFIHLKSLFVACFFRLCKLGFVQSVCSSVQMPVCKRTHARMRTHVCVVCMYALRIVSTDKILPFINTLIIMMCVLRAYVVCVACVYVCKYMCMWVCWYTCASCSSFCVLPVLAACAVTVLDPLKGSWRCHPLAWNLRAVIWFPFPVSSLGLLFVSWHDIYYFAYAPVSCFPPRKFSSIFQRDRLFLYSLRWISRCSDGW